MILSALGIFCISGSLGLCSSAFPCFSASSLLEPKPTLKPNLNKTSNNLKKMNPSRKIPCNVKLWAQKVLQIQWKIRGSNSKILQTQLKWQLPLASSKENGQRSRFKKKKTEKSNSQNKPDSDKWLWWFINQRYGCELVCLMSMWTIECIHMYLYVYIYIYKTYILNQPVAGALQALGISQYLWVINH